jgi:hypothetical protein
MRDLASPIGAFVREQCDTGADKQVAVDELYGAFKIWAENNGHATISSHSQPQLLSIRRHYVGADCRIPRVIAKRDVLMRAQQNLAGCAHIRDCVRGTAKIYPCQTDLDFP